MGHYLDGFSQIVPMSFAVNHRFVDATSCYRVVSCCVYACEALVVAQIEVGLKAVLRHIALAVLVGVQRPRVDVNIRVKLLYCYLVAACLQQFPYRGGDDALSQRGNHAARDEDVLCIHKNKRIYGLQRYLFSGGQAC